MKKPLKSCCNGCPKPPKPPSWVLCEDCFAKLDAKMEALSRPQFSRVEETGNVNDHLSERREEVCRAALAVSDAFSSDEPMRLEESGVEFCKRLEALRTALGRLYCGHMVVASPAPPLRPLADETTERK